MSFRMFENIEIDLSQSLNSKQFLESFSGAAHRHKVNLRLPLDQPELILLVVFIRLIRGSYFA